MVRLALLSVVLVGHVRGFNPPAVVPGQRAAPNVRPQTVPNGVVMPRTNPYTLPDSFSPSGRSFLPPTRPSDPALMATLPEAGAMQTAVQEVEETAPMQAGGDSWSVFEAGMLGAVVGALSVLGARFWRQSSAAPQQRSLFSMTDHSPSPPGSTELVEPLYAVSPELGGALQGPLLAHFDPAVYNWRQGQQQYRVDGTVVTNTYKPKDPLTARVISNETLTGPDAGEVVHVAFEHEGKLPYIEGQSIGIIAPGVDAQGKPHKLRLYSIASSAPGDYGDGRTISLCVKRLIYEDEDGKEVRGVCSNFIGDLKPGDEVQVTGPVGKALLLPDDPKANVIMLATGTGIAPFRSFLWRFFLEEHPEYKFDGLAWLFLGVPTTSALLYDNENKKMKEIAGDKFRYDYAISREQTDADGNKMYIQNRMKQYAKELWDLMQKDNTSVYMCGLKGMEVGIQEALQGVAKENGVEWADFVKKLKSEKRYHVEVY